MQKPFFFSYYRELRPSTIREPRYRHLLLLLFWPIFGAVFWTLEIVWPHIWAYFMGEALYYYPIEVAFDAKIPFCEWFILPYLFWFLFLVGMILYGLLFDILAFRRFSWFVILSYSATAIVYLLFPNMQALRPVEFARENLLTAIVQGLYSFDTNTNVCPSIHVLGSLAVCIAGLHAKRLHKWGWRLFFILSTTLISLSTVFLKQHSIVDVLAALALGAVCYPIVLFVLCPDREGRHR